MFDDASVSADTSPSALDSTAHAGFPWRAYVRSAPSRLIAEIVLISLTISSARCVSRRTCRLRPARSRSSRKSGVQGANHKASGRPTAPRC
eukprot:2740702-Pleurochrysis_carterae.AAC.6